ncbi:hypothetical protein MAR_028927 [Mya arenaria]|uniref:Uncharacterized protein n=1 Tax=Mya arenaria TaxID=6604 RepID=A0ABY7DF12_MYAAR|nr:hypothetical protein MAR_028927 [Mya arenaria]
MGDGWGHLELVKFRYFYRTRPGIHTSPMNKAWTTHSIPLQSRNSRAFFSQKSFSLSPINSTTHGMVISRNRREKYMYPEMYMYLQYMMYRKNLCLIVMSVDNSCGQILVFIAQGTKFPNLWCKTSPVTRHFCSIAIILLAPVPERDSWNIILRLVVKSLLRNPCEVPKSLYSIRFNSSSVNCNLHAFEVVYLWEPTSFLHFTHPSIIITIILKFNVRSVDYPEKPFFNQTYDFAMGNLYCNHHKPCVVLPKATIDCRVGRGRMSKVVIPALTTNPGAISEICFSSVHQHHVKAFSELVRQLSLPVFGTPNNFINVCNLFSNLKIYSAMKLCEPPFSAKDLTVLHKASGESTVLWEHREETISFRRISYASAFSTTTPTEIIIIISNKNHNSNHHTTTTKDIIIIISSSSTIIIIIIIIISSSSISIIISNNNISRRHPALFLPYCMIKLMKMILKACNSFVGTLWLQNTFQNSKLQICYMVHILKQTIQSQANTDLVSKPVVRWLVDKGQCPAWPSLIDCLIARKHNWRTSSPNLRALQIFPSRTDRQLATLQENEEIGLYSFPPL